MAPPPPALPPRNRPLPPPVPPRRPRSPSLSARSEGFDVSTPPRRNSDTQYLMPYTQSPPRSPSRDENYRDSPPPAYEEQWGGGDPRSSSMHSLVPVESPGSNRRTLLMIYIHGFMGTDTSFKSFPAHVHNLLTVTLGETHVVHTKIYPRYESRRAMDFARDAFSDWLTPHESPTTDVILVGHSLGGILAAEVALLQSYSSTSPQVYQHRILGVMAFDTPFLGMHPGLIGTGIASLFRPGPDIPEFIPDDSGSISPSDGGIGSPLSATQSIASNLFSTTSTDPNFNPSFANDILKPQRQGWEKALYFVNKHSDGLGKAAKNYVMSHLEFGGCMADYPGLKRRYVHMRAMEDVDELAHPKDPKGRSLRRVRFVNYYSASTGRLKPPKSPKSPATPAEEPPEAGMKDMTLVPTASDGEPSGMASPSTGPRLSLEEHTEEEVIEKPLDELDPMPMEYDEEDEHGSKEALSNITNESQGAEQSTSEPGNIEPGATEPKDTEPGSTEPDSTELGNQETRSQDDTGVASALTEEVSNVESLPPVPPMPEGPANFDPSKYKDKDTLKVAQKENARQVKAYERAKKDREKSIRDRERLIQKREKEVTKKQEKVAREAAKQQEKKAKEAAKQQEKEAKEAAKQFEQENKELNMQLEQEAKLAKQKLDTELKDRIKRATTINPEMYDAAIRDAESTGSPSEQKRRKKQRDRKFCTLPSKDPKTGLRDQTWIRVYMEGVDEVVAHVTLFIPSETYEKLVGDATARVEEWVREDATTRLMLEETEGGEGGGRGGEKRDSYDS